MKKIQPVEPTTLQALGRSLQALRIEERLTQKELAKAAGISKSAVAQVEGGFIKPPFELLWYFAERGKDVFNILNQRDPQKVASFEERRSVNRKTGLTEQEAQIIAAWLETRPEIKNLIVAWAKARMGGPLAKVFEAELVEFDAKAKAAYLLSTVKDEAEEEKAPGG